MPKPFFWRLLCIYFKTVSLNTIYPIWALLCTTKHLLVRSISKSEYQNNFTSTVFGRRLLSHAQKNENYYWLTKKMLQCRTELNFSFSKVNTRLWKSGVKFQLTSCKLPSNSLTNYDQANYYKLSGSQNVVLKTLRYLLWSQEPEHTSLSPDPGGLGIRSPEYTFLQSMEPSILKFDHLNT